MTPKTTPKTTLHMVCYMVCTWLHTVCTRCYMVTAKIGQVIDFVCYTVATHSLHTVLHGPRKPLKSLLHGLHTVLHGSLPPKGGISPPLWDGANPQGVLGRARMIEAPS
jgi:hypothetical protein